MHLLRLTKLRRVHRALAIRSQQNGSKMLKKISRQSQQCAHGL